MKNREVRVFIASMMLVSMVAGSLSGIPANGSETGNVTVTTAEYAAAENKQTAKTDSEKKSSEEKSPDKKSSAAKARKDETVYAKIDGSGSVKSVTVSDQLKNISDKAKLNDISDLQNIVNVKGDEAFSTMGSSVVWDTADADICYQGTTTKELPVGILISYKLDGKDISAADLKGKSGHVTIRYTYENKSGSKGKASTPFMMATGLILDEKIFKNITVENGKLISDGERNMVIGYGFPAMKNILGIEDKDLDIPDYFEVEADVTGYEPVEGLTIATNSIFNDLDTEGFDSLNELNDSMDELQDASSQLVSGSGELKNGIDTLLSSSGTLTDGIDQLVAGGGELQSGTSELADGSNQLLDGSKQLADGSKELADGNAKLADGSRELADGNAKLADGTKQLYDGTKTLASGAGELNLGLKTAADKTQNVLLPGVKALDLGVAQMQSQLEQTLPELCSGVKNLDVGMQSAKEGAVNLNAGAASLNAGADQVASGVELLNENMKVAVAGVQELSNGIAGLSEVVYGLAQQMSDSAMVSDMGNLSGNAAALEGQLVVIQQNAAIAASETDGSGIANTALDALNSVQGAIQTIEDPEAAAIASDAVNSAVNQIYSNTGTGENYAAALAAEQASSAIETVQVLSAELEASQNTQMQQAAVPDVTPLITAMKDLTAGVNQLLVGLETAQNKLDSELVPGAQSVSGGAQMLQENMENLQKGLEELAAGTSVLNASVNDPSNGLTAQVNSGVAQLKSGTSQLVAGVDGENGLASGLNQLSAGAQQLDTGSTQLSEKMGEANEGAKSAASGAAKLASGASEAASGASELASGASDLQSGAYDLSAGANKLNDGALTLTDGLNTLKSGSGELIDGVQKLDDGAAELNDGMIKFDRDGIQKLVDAFGGDVEELLDKMNEMLDASRAYKNFSGISDDMDGEVKFVFVTEE